MQPSTSRDREFLRDLQRFLARYATTGSTFRNIGFSGAAAAAYEFLADVDLSRFSNIDKGRFSVVLDTVTLELAGAMPKPVWGFARKGLNIFLRDCFYNRYIHDHYGLQEIEPFLEVPLDGHVMEEICRRGGDSVKPTAIKNLDSSISADLQKAASLIAAQKNRSRVHLDLRWWGGER